MRYKILFCKFGDTGQEPLRGSEVKEKLPNGYSLGLIQLCP